MQTANCPVGGRPATTRVRVVDDIVVEQCGRLEQLERCTDLEHGLGAVGVGHTSVRAP